MDKEELLSKFEELFKIKEVTQGFPSQQACINWTNKVAPLLQFNPQYYQTFLHYSEIINSNISVYTAEPAFRNMISQVEMAIEELKNDIENIESHDYTVKINDVESKNDVIELKPNFFGLGINLNEFWRRFKHRFIRDSKN